MRTLIYFGIAIGMLCYHLFTNPIQLDSCSASDTIIEVNQGGSSLKIIGVGNSVLNYTETIDGYTLIKNNEQYEYAIKNKLGDLVASGIIASNPEDRNATEKIFLEGIQPKLRHSKVLRNRLLREYSESIHSESDYNEFPNSGNRKVLVLLIQYPDLQQEYSRVDFQNMMNQPNYNNTGSFRDYFLKNSFNQLDLNTDVFGWYTSEENYAYYGNVNGSSRAMQLVAEALDAAEAAGVDFSKYDNDDDGELDGIVIIHSGPGAEVGAQNQYIWSQRNRLTEQYRRNYDGTLIEQFIINPETRPWGMVGIGVFCHEFGHLLGLPDLYDLDNSSSGIGNWGLMGKGSWLNSEKTPANLCAWSKEKQNWIMPTVISEGFHTLASSDNNNEIFRINTDNPSEYFLLENRQKVGNDQYLPGEGLAIWHIDTERTSLFPTSNFVNIDEDHKGVDLEEADGLFNLDNRQGNGDGGDLFPGSANNTVFNNASVPSSNLYSSEDSELAITSISNINGTVSFVLNGIGEVPCDITNVTPRTNFVCGGDLFVLEMEVEYNYSATDKKLYVNGNAFDLIGSPQKVFLENLPANGQKVAVEISIGEDAACNYINNEIVTAPKTYQIERNETTCNPNEVGIYAEYLSSVSGCDSIIITNFVLDQPEVNFNYKVEGFEVSFNNITTEGDNFIWHFGDGATSYEYNPTHIYTNADTYNVTLQALADDCTIEKVDEIVVNGETVTSNIEVTNIEKNFNIYPNPVRNNLNIDLNDLINTPVIVSIFDLSGKLILTENLAVGASNLSLDMNGLDAGSYLVEILTDNNSLVQQLVKL